jgi:CRP/FNR family transcriptional regulator, cyclic AMP receptor protein
MESLEPILAQHPFLQGLDPTMLSHIVGCASNVRFDANQDLFEEGDEAKQVFIIRSGNVAIEMNVPGRGAVTIQTVGAGEILGWSWLLPPYLWHFTARSTELTRAIVLDATCLRNKCEEDPRLGYEIMKRFAGILEDRVESMRLQLLDIYSER